MSKKPSVTERAFLATSKAKSGVEGDTAPPPRFTPSTAPGSMAAHLARESQVLIENVSLKDELKQWAGATPARLLDPHSVVPSQWANRDAASFKTQDFADLKGEIESAGGNVQPIKVRPILTALPDQPQQYEIVFGHRRHRAALELGLPVNAVIEDMPDEMLFVQMDRENRNRKDLSAWEQGKMYVRALDEGLFLTIKKMASALGVDAGHMGKAITLARLPVEIIAAFDSPLDLQFRWSGLLREALDRDPAGVMAKAGRIAASRESKKASDIFSALIEDTPLPPVLAVLATSLPPDALGALATQPKTEGEPDHLTDSAALPYSDPPTPPAQPPNLLSTWLRPISQRQFKIMGQSVGTMKSDDHGLVSIKVKKPLSADHQEKLAILIDSFLKGIQA